MLKALLSSVLLVLSISMTAQNARILGVVHHESELLPYVSIGLKNSSLGTQTNEKGQFEFKGLVEGTYRLTFNYLGFKRHEIEVNLSQTVQELTLDISLEPIENKLEEVVITGTMKPMSRSESPVPVEIYTAKFFSANPTPSLFESLQHVNGVRPQLNCNVCNTGDIHINGLEGPYTMVLLDGMPIVSGLSTVYGLTGIPQSLIDRIEIVKGPASTLYGSEAVGGVINVITRSPDASVHVSADLMATSWQEYNLDIGASVKINKTVSALLGVNHFLFDQTIDKNGDGFTDVALQDRKSFFSKWSFTRPSTKPLHLAMHYVHENRWGGETQWTAAERGGDQIYAESIYIDRWELIGTYGLPVKEDIKLQWSANSHVQDAAYGITLFQGAQYIGYAQLIWNKELNKRNDLLLGSTYRYTHYNDNTFATGSADNDVPSQTHLPGLFAQDQWKLHEQWTMLSGMRWDYNSAHGHIFTPRLNLKWNSKDKRTSMRLSLGNGYRIAQVFTEDHAALTGAREVVFLDELKPERSWNTNLNALKRISCANGTFITLDASAWYTYFSQRILPDYNTDPNKIIYANLNGHSISQGLSLSIDIDWSNGIDSQLGITAMDLSVTEEGKAPFRPVLTENISAVWQIGYSFPSANISIEYTGNLYSPMKLPLLGPLDERPAESPWWSTQNIKCSKSFTYGIDLYFGIKNLLDFTPPANSIARAFDPFDQEVTFDEAGQVVPSPENPQALTFDPSYVFAPNQGRRFFIGISYTLRKKAPNLNEI